MKTPSATAVIDLQFGSTGKGSLAGFMGEYGEFDAVATAWGPNAGHTSVYDDGTECVRTMLSNAVFRSETISKVFIGPGSMVNPEALISEIAHNKSFGQTDFLVLIHESAAVVLPADRDAEASYGFKIGSTMKGTAEAVMRKMRRRGDGPLPSTMGEWAATLGKDSELANMVVPHKTYLAHLYNSKRVLLEGCQGYSLGINSGFWPHTTSRECSVPQLMSDTLMPLHSLEEVIGTLRTYPIRVANRYKDGEMVGTSGGCYFDQDEINWSDIGVEPELTTVTKLPRRVFTFSEMQIKEAIVRNSVNTLFVNFVNYLPTQAHRDEFFAALDKATPPGVSVAFKGYGRKISDIHVEGPWAEVKRDIDAEKAHA